MSTIRICDHCGTRLGDGREYTVTVRETRTDDPQNLIPSVPKTWELCAACYRRPYPDTEVGIHGD